MCGIAGKINFNQNRGVKKEDLVKMCQTLVHRGPDDEGYYTNQNIGFGMRRLSVIDIESGGQPIHNEDKTVWVICNGEIYNFLNLREKLKNKGHKFHTHSDTEVIVHLYEEYGLDFTKHLKGMFALALWDEKKKRFVLARDRMGIKPLYFAKLSDRLVFASELKAVKQDCPSLTLDQNALSVYLSLLYIPSPYSIYKEVEKLRPGYQLVWENNKTDIQKYWDLSDIKPFESDVSAEELQREFRNLLLSSVKSQLVSDVPLGFFLSGGLDSSAVVACARQADKNANLKTFSVGFEDSSYDETDKAELVAKHLQTQHRKVEVRLNEKNLIEKLVSHFDEPFADSSAIPVYFLSQLARRHVKVALSGDGGDELFAGYITYQADKLAKIYDNLPKILSRKILPKLAKAIPVSDKRVSLGLKARRFTENALLEPNRRHYAWKAFFSEEMKKDLLLNKDIVDGFLPFKHFYNEAQDFDDLSSFQYADAMVYLPGNNLTKVDRMSMAHSLEARVPLLDKEIVEFAFRLPESLRMPGLKLKSFFRESIRQMLPAEIIDQKKKGFNVPMSSWLKNEFRLITDHYLSEKVIKQQGFFNPQTVDFLLKEHRKGKNDYSRNIWALLVFNVWAEQTGLNQ